MKLCEKANVDVDYGETRPEEVIGILMAISVVSKRLAKRLSAFETRMDEDKALKFKEET